MKTQFVSTLDSIEELLPQKGWLRDYVTYTKTLEACPRFRFFTACCVMGASINNRVWLQRGAEGLLPKLFPNVWVVLLAPPGRGHKTSTINMAVDVLMQACPDIRLISNKITPEAVIRALSEPGTPKETIRIGPRDATGLITAPELSVFFGRQQYNTGLVSLITDLYDYREEWSSDTIMRGKNVLRRVCISVLGGSTPDWLQTMLPQDAFTGGFMSRFVLVEMPPNYFKRRALPERVPGGDWSSLVSRLRVIAQQKGQMTWSEEAEQAYIKFYENLLPSGDVQKDAYQERAAEQILKIAMLIALSVNRMEVTKQDFLTAKGILDGLMEETSPRIERLTTHPRMSLVQDIEDLLRKFPEGLTERELINRTYRGLQGGEAQFREALRILLLGGKIEKENKYQNPTYWLTSIRKGKKSNE